jgi:hypothetical protein
VWRPEPTRVENLGDELWVGVKGQSNSVIAGSPRNAFRCSVACFVVGVELLAGLGGLPAYRSQPNSEYHYVKCGSETAGDKLRRREGNSPELRLRPQSVCLVGKDVGLPRQPGGWLRSSHP